jgi:hypothetical protein
MLTRSDHGNKRFNFLGVGSDIASAALTNAYYPHQNRGFGLFFTNWGIVMARRIGNNVLHKFVLRRFTTHANRQ